MPEMTVVELRQYTLHRGGRDVLIDLFEREFVAPQEAVGAHVLGTFRDLDDPDRFVWLRGFADMNARKAALEAFYGGPVWKAHREAANATILDSDNVLLLRPVDNGIFATPSRGRGRLLRGAIHYLGNVDSGDFTAFFDQALAPRIATCGGRVAARYATETALNSFPRLPIREHERVFIWFAGFEDERTERRFSERLDQETGWRDGVSDKLLPALMRKPELLRLSSCT